jgi:putative endonuclease
MRDPKTYYVYFMASVQRHHVLYTGITCNLPRRVYQHKTKYFPGFTSKYNVNRLVFYESYSDPMEAIGREKEIKAWRRSKKVRLIESMNPNWNDLARDWFPAVRVA